MMKLMTIVSKRIQIAAIATVAIALFSGTSPADSGTAFAHPPGHLYVLYEGSYKSGPPPIVVRYPLAQDGLPATTPDGLMYPQGELYPTGMAVDDRGDIFLASEHGWGGGAVAEFSASAMSQQSPRTTRLQQPDSILNLVGEYPDLLKFDNAERLYVHLYVSQNFAIFAMGAHGHATPIAVVPSYNKDERVSDFAISKSGVLYVLDGLFAQVAVYDNPLRASWLPDWYMRPDQGEGLFDSALGLDESTNRLFIQFDEGSYKGNTLTFDARPLSKRPLGAASSLVITNGQCGSPEGGTYVHGAMVAKNYLIIPCVLGPSEVMVFRTDQFGKRKAVETFGEHMRFPWEIALGP